MEQEQAWSNEQVLSVFMDEIVEYIYKTASDMLPHVKETAAFYEEDYHLRDMLVGLQRGVVGNILMLINGDSGPRKWPGVKLVNGTTLEVLNEYEEELTWALSEAEGRHIEPYDTDISDPVDDDTTAL